MFRYQAVCLFSVENTSFFFFVDFCRLKTCQKFRNSFLMIKNNQKIKNKKLVLNNKNKKKTCTISIFCTIFLFTNNIVTNNIRAQNTIIYDFFLLLL